ncbi:hypothetical protein IQ268_23760 [Oculatella sp. LEGE 06141]|uniref:hypothetical protein n=1 Tax=Oculatella sp. LEGE 06141 TaxID=1828648 RepID=UPI001881CA3A|nr:hypothetical protein [Oculatella sp. LEGE 06141]MBE9181584.1 hypothetical protein [Oculatella sp. LEGE 06141]
MKSTLLATLAGVGLIVGTGRGAIAQMPQHMDESSGSTAPTEVFRSIEQPLAIKAGVTLGGVALIGAELWWFLFSKPKSQ